MEPGLTLAGQHDHGPPDPPLLTEWRHGQITNPLPEQPDPPGLCPRCLKECRDFTSVGGVEYCDGCAEMVRDIKSMFRACEAQGTGQP